MTISERIFSLLKEKKLSQKDLSKYTGISEAAISGWKTKHTTPTSDKLTKISEFLGVSVNYLLTGTESPAPIFPEGTALIMDSACPSSTFLLDKTEMEMLQMFRLLSDLDKGRILGMLEMMTERK